jgi:hypothetical protein
MVITDMVITDTVIAWSSLIWSSLRWSSVPTLSASAATPAVVGHTTTSAAGPHPYDRGVRTREPTERILLGTYASYGADRPRPGGAW